MKFSIGDKIILKRTGEEGHVTSYINKQMVEVEVNGTTFPVYEEDIDHPYLKWFTTKTKKKQSLPEQLPVEKEKHRPQRLAKGVYLSFMPVFINDGFEEVAETLKIFLLNEMPQPIKFVYDVRRADNSLFRHEGVLHGFGNIYLHSIAYGDMNDQPRFHWQLTDTTNPQMETAEGILRIRPAKLFEHINSILMGGDPTFNYTLIEDFSPKKPKPAPEKPTFSKAHVQQSQPATITTRNIEPPRYEIDLHIEKLRPNVKGLSNAEIVNIQLDALRHYIQLAIVHHQQRLIVIHGLGKGKLREEVHAILKQTPEVSRYKNEWSGRYGFGATEVFFRY
jgi:hypothetical protein